MKTRTILPPAKQSSWGILSAFFFSIVGIGAGLHITSTILILEAGGYRQFFAQPIPFSFISSLTIISGFALIALDTSRPIRGLRAISNIRRSWISREILVFLSFIIFIFLDYLASSILWRALSVGSGLLLLFCQASILRRSTAISAWNTPLIIPMFISSGLSSGFGYALILNWMLPSFESVLLASIGIILLILNFATIVIYIFTKKMPDSTEETSIIEKPLFIIINMGFSIVLPMVLLLLIFFNFNPIYPWIGRDIFLLVTGITMLMGGFLFKVSIITLAGYTKAISFSEHLPPNLASR
jgi:DMSO reductase anchor subunit